MELEEQYIQKKKEDKKDKTKGAIVIYETNNEEVLPLATQTNNQRGYDGVKRSNTD